MTAPHSPLYLLARFVDGPYAGQERTVAPGADGGPRARITLPGPVGAAGVTYERVSWGAGDPVRYRVAGGE